MEKVERTQYQAALDITGTWQGTNRSELYEELVQAQAHSSYLRDKLPLDTRIVFFLA